MFNGYAMEYGTFLGVAFLAVFAAYVGGLRVPSGLLLFGSMVGLPLLAVFAGYLAMRYKRQVADGVAIPYSAAFVWCFMMLMYANFLAAAGEYVYFRWLDGGAMVESFRAMLNDGTLTAQYAQMGMQDSLEELKQMVEAFAALSPQDLVLGYFNVEMMVAIPLAFVLAFLVKKTGR